MYVQNNEAVFISDNRIFVGGKELPPVPSRDNGAHITSNMSIINNKVFIDGYEFKDGKWKRTLRALWHLFF